MARENKSPVLATPTFQLAYLRRQRKGLPHPAAGHHGAEKLKAKGPMTLRKNSACVHGGIWRTNCQRSLTLRIPM
jgi:hypothetical protein